MKFSDHCRLIVVLCGTLVLSVAGCSRQSDNAEEPEAGVPITVTQAMLRDVPVEISSTGRLESRAAPAVAAEVDGRVMRLAVDEGENVAQGAVLAELDATMPRLEQQAARAELQRLRAMRENAQARANRLRDLRGKGFVSVEQLDDAEAALAMARAEEGAVEARLRLAEDQLARTVVRAPLAGSIQTRLVSIGDFVKRGSPLFEIATSAKLRAVLPFPESLGTQLAAGQAVSLSSALVPGFVAKGVIAEIRPSVGRNSRAVWAVVDIENPGQWRPGATVRGEVVVAVHRNAVLVPAQALVRRPAGEVVYLIEQGQARQRMVSSGVQIDGLVEVDGSIAAGDSIAVEGAAYLSEGAAVRVLGATP